LKIFLLNKFKVPNSRPQKFKVTFPEQARFNVIDLFNAKKVNHFLFLTLGLGNWNLELGILLIWVLLPVKSNYEPLLNIISKNSKKNLFLL
jgi:hypothetical protein